MKKDTLKSYQNLIPIQLIRWLTKLPFLTVSRLKEIERYFNQPGMRCYLGGDLDKTDDKVIIYGLRMSCHYNLAVFEKVFSDCFRFHGAAVKNLLCDGFLSSCDAAIEGEPDFVHCFACRNHKSSFFSLYPNDFIFMSEYVTNHDSLQVKERIAALGDDQLQDYHYLGVHVGKHAMDSCIKYFRQGLFDKDNPLHYKQLRNYVYQGAALVKVGEGLLKKEKPSHFFTLHGCYSSWGPIAEYLAAQGVRVYIYRKSINKVGDFDFIQYGEDANDILAKQVWEAAQYRPLDTDKKETLRLFLGKKRNGQTLDYKLYSLGKKEKKSDSLEKMIRSDHKKKYALYAHLLWDRGFNTLGGLFKDDIEWMFETIEYFINQKELFLIIKPHPAERSYFDWTEKGVKDVILKRYGALPDHIVILDNDYPLTSFDLMGAGFIGLVYNGTTGLEHSYFKKPALVAANIHYLSAGAALRINTREEYFRTIDDPSPLYAFVENNYDRIERYAYHYYYRQQIPIPFFRKDIFLGHCIDWDVLKDYKDFIEKDKIVNHIVTSILAGAPVVNPD